MSENIENIVLEHLKRLQAEMSEMREQNQEIINRLGNIESGIARISRDTSANYTEIIEDRHELDRLKERIKRIEKRLELS